jgi:hypothetical protein
MVSNRRSLTFLPAALLLCVMSLGQADASAPRSLDLTMSIAKIMQLDQPAATIIVGNPEIADISIVDGLTMVLTGRAVGVTNLIAMDANGGEIVNVELRVSAVGPRHVVVRIGTRAATFICTPTCRPVQTPRPPAPATSPPIEARSETAPHENQLPVDDAIHDSFDVPQIEDVPD